MKRYVKGFEYIPLILILIISYKLLNNFQIVKDAYWFAIGILMPFLWGFTFAYLINPLMMLLEKKFKLKRFVSIIIAYAIVSIIVSIAFTFILPEVTNSATDIMENMPRYIDGTEALLTDIAKQYPILFSNQDMRDPLTKAIQSITEFGAGVVSQVLKSAISFANHMLKLVIGIIISIYFLLDKEKFVIGAKKILFGILDEKTAKHIIDFGSDVNNMFSKFIVGKTIDSLIIGIIAYVGMLLIKAPYPVLFAFIIGITNMIPFFGPFIGGIPVVIVTFFFSPLTGLWAALFILLLQQFDGYILGPKILGDSVGLSAFWIILSILVGGALFGVIGMLVAVPTTAVLRNRVLKYLDLSLEQKGIKL